MFLNIPNQVSNGVIPNGIRSYSTTARKLNSLKASSNNILNSNNDILNKGEKLDPRFVTGFSDGESLFKKYQ